MNTFVVIAVRPGRSVAPETWWHLERGSPPLHFVPHGEHRWIDPTGRVLVRGWERPNPAFGIESHWCVGQEGVTTFVGHLWPRTGAWSTASSWAEQLSSRLRRGRVERQIEDHGGLYSVVDLDVWGRGHVFNDVLGLRMIYAAGTDDYDVYASRADAAAWSVTSAGHDPGRDEVAAAWLPYAKHFVGDRTGFSGVRVLPAGTSVEIDPARGGRPHVWSEAPWRSDDERSPDELAERARADIAANVRAILALPAQKVCGLTGGRDSRLVLSALIEADAADQVEFRTLGSGSLPDVVVARELAATYGLRHRWGVEGPGHPSGGVTAEPFEVRARRQVRDSGGMLNIWDSPGGGEAAGTINVTGLCGEVLRTYYPRTDDIVSWEQLLVRYANGWRFGERGMLRDGTFAELEGLARQSLFDDPSGDSTPRDLVDAFYIRNRLRRWMGTAEEMERTSRVYPLYGVDAVRAAFAIGADRRRSEYLHRRVMDLNAPGLAALPFADTPWPVPPPEAARRAGVPCGPIPSEMIDGTRTLAALTGSDAATSRSRGAGPELPRNANQEFQGRSLGRKRPLVEAALAGAANPVYRVLDRGAVADAVENMDVLAVQDRIRLFGAASAAIWLNG